ncbi:MAG: hypothetical protein KDJ50_02590 [Alphaproteobacteria bacterium]|nr:hypothetical protein [Alphaproteobacteria bacterium]
MNKIRFAALSLSLICSSFGIANAEPYVYAPDNCEMRIAFPEQPTIEKKCQANKEKVDCHEVLTYKKIAPPDASVTVRVTCVEYNKEDLETYTPPVVEQTLNQLLKDQGLEPFDIQSGEVGDMRRSTSLSIGTSDDGIAYMYSGQIWIGKTSLFTLEANMKGPEEKSIEADFVSILRETYPKNAEKEKNKKKNQSE